MSSHKAVVHIALALSITACQSQSDAGPTAKSAPEAKATPEAKAKPEAKSEPEAKAKPETKSTPEAKAAPEAKATPEAKAAPDTEPSPRSGAFDLKSVHILELRDSGDPDEWMVSTPVTLTEAQERFLDTHTIDPYAEGLTHPFPKDAPLTLVTAEGIFSRKATGYEVYREMDDDLLVALLGEAKGGKGLAIIGKAQPVATARMRELKHEPPSAELLADLKAEAKGLSAKLIAEFEPIDDPDGDKPDPATLALTPECVHVYRPTLPNGFDRVVTIGCGGEAVYEPKLSAVFLVGRQDRRPFSERSKWSLDYSTYELADAVDLDGDGVDEVIMETSGYELWEVSAFAWDGSRYAIVPG